MQEQILVDIKIGINDVDANAAVRSEDILIDHMQEQVLTGFTESRQQDMLVFAFKEAARIGIDLLHHGIYSELRNIKQFRSRSVVRIIKINEQIANGFLAAEAVDH